MENRHSKMVSFFNDIKIDKFNNRAKFVDECVLYLEPEDLRDKYIELAKLVKFQIMFPLVSHLCFHFFKQVSRV
ncbi:hypothetical protein [Aliarcobacter butzleri]|uniref:hypothetical protein n=1 Tax=Aliarcobacter butzleri TaxID=28197 RepID=UPI0018DFCB73|nr:hypothetical protein [Aliarcobacter butzleri]